MRNSKRFLRNKQNELQTKWVNYYFAMWSWKRNMQWKSRWNQRQALEVKVCMCAQKSTRKRKDSFAFCTLHVSEWNGTNQSIESMRYTQTARQRRAQQNNNHKYNKQSLAVSRLRRALRTLRSCTRSWEKNGFELSWTSTQCRHQFFFFFFSLLFPFVCSSTSFLSFALRGFFCFVRFVLDSRLLATTMATSSHTELVITHETTDRPQPSTPTNRLKQKQKWWDEVRESEWVAWMRRHIFSLCEIFASSFFFFATDGTHTQHTTNSLSFVKSLSISFLFYYFASLIWCTPFFLSMQNGIFRFFFRRFFHWTCFFFILSTTLFSEQQAHALHIINEIEVICGWEGERRSERDEKNVC